MNVRHRYRIAVFARNEERRIVAALRAVLHACPSERDLQIHVLVNGCTDRTLQLVSDFGLTQPEVVVDVIPLGDKAHAWNTYVYELADDSPCHFFTDGDVECSPGALEKMQETLLANDGAMAIAGVPLSGRHRDRLLQYIRERHWLFGNLYAIKHAQLAKLRRAGVRLPIGVCGSDHFISKFAAARSFTPTTLTWEQNIHRPDAGYLFHSLQPFRRVDWQIYLNRRVTQALRQLQISELDGLDLSHLPATMDEVNKRLLSRLEVEHLSPANVLLRAVRGRLRRMYPTSDATVFTKWLS